MSHTPIDTSPVTGKGRVNRVAPNVIDGMVTVLVNLEPALPGETRAGTEVSGTIQGPTLNNVAYVGRPVSCRPGSEGTLFKVEPGGQEAMRVKVRYGQFGHTPVKVVQIRDGLAAGDRVIASDMSAYAGQERVRLR